MVKHITQVLRHCASTVSATAFVFLHNWNVRHHSVQVHYINWFQIRIQAVQNNWPQVAAVAIDSIRYSPAKHCPVKPSGADRRLNRRHTPSATSPPNTAAASRVTTAISATVTSSDKTTQSGPSRTESWTKETTFATSSHRQCLLACLFVLPSFFLSFSFFLFFSLPG